MSKYSYNTVDGSCTERCPHGITVSEINKNIRHIGGGYCFPSGCEYCEYKDTTEKYVICNCPVMQYPKDATFMEAVEWMELGHKATNPDGDKIIIKYDILVIDDCAFYTKLGHINGIWKLLAPKKEEKENSHIDEVAQSIDNLIVEILQMSGVNNKTIGYFLHNLKIAIDKMKT